MDRAVEHDARHLDGGDQPVDRDHRPAGDLPRDPPQPTDPVEHELPAVDAAQLHGRDGGAGREPRPGGGHIRPSADVQPRLRDLHRSARSCCR